MNETKARERVRRDEKKRVAQRRGEKGAEQKTGEKKELEGGRGRSSRK